LPIPIVADVTCRGSTGASRKLLQVANLSARRVLKQTLAEFRPDVVHLRMFMTQLSPIILPLLRNVPTVHHVVNYDLICPLNTKRLPDGSACRHRPGAVCHATGCLPWIGVLRGVAQANLAHRWLRHIDRIVCNSHWVRNRLEAEGISVSGVIWNGIPERTARQELAAQPLLVCASRMFPKKGIDVFIRAIGEIKDSAPALRVIIAGDGPELPALKSLSAQLGLDTIIEFTGHLPRERMEELFAPAWAQIVPSSWEEPFGLVAAEAQMRATATIVSNVGGPTEIIEEGVTGRCFNVGDAADLARVIREIIQDRDSADRMGRAGRDRALRYFREDIMVDRFESLYHEMIAPAGAAR
jgi:glycosyltransferase involved in cell wall biosynthesis